jgi:hypothetical protein
MMVLFLLSWQVLLAVATDTNPKRQRGRQVVTSLALRVNMDCDNFNREQ